MSDFNYKSEGVADRIFTGGSLQDRCLILVDNGIISGLIDLPDCISVLSMQIEEIQGLYCHRKVYYSAGCYAIPGLTDLTIRSCSEDESSLSQAAYMGGITHGFIEDSSQTAFTSLNLLPIEVISSTAKLQASASHVKTYLSQPDWQTPHTHDIGDIVREANELNKVVVVDCSLNDPRILAMASPFRTEPDASRLTTIVVSHQVFGSALDLNLNQVESGSDEEEEEKEEKEEDKSIIKHNPVIEADLKTYASPGRTIFSENRGVGLKRPLALMIPSGKKDMGYDDYLHNIPRTWELRGVKHVTENIPEACQVQQCFVR